MDLSVLAAVGSFVVSERVLKPKASLLFILACVLAYDLTTKTHDVSSLRVYRGPAMIGFCLFMAAYSLRTWRRNGVACDEFLFLPGSAHGQTHGIDDCPEADVVQNNQHNHHDISENPYNQNGLVAINNNNNHNNHHDPNNHEQNKNNYHHELHHHRPETQHQQEQQNNIYNNHLPMSNEGDAAAGIGWCDTTTKGQVPPPRRRNQNSHTHTATTVYNPTTTTTTTTTPAMLSSSSPMRDINRGRSQSDEIYATSSPRTRMKRGLVFGVDNNNNNESDSSLLLGLNSSIDEVMDHYGAGYNNNTNNDNINTSMSSSSSKTTKKQHKNSFDFAFPWESDNDDDDSNSDDAIANNNNSKNNNNNNNKELNSTSNNNDNNNDNSRGTPRRFLCLSRAAPTLLCQESSSFEDTSDDADADENNNKNDNMRNNNNNSSSSNNNSDKVGVFSISNGEEEEASPSYDNKNNNPTDDDSNSDREEANNETITRIGSFFFFRSSTTSTHNAAYAPSGPAVVGAALDLSMPILFNFHLFIEAYNSVARSGNDDNNNNNENGKGMTETQAKLLPLVFLTVLMFRSCFPPGRRGRFWSTIKFTVTAPFHRIRFRDAFVGDVITSLVRTGQDLLFALSYYLTVIWGSITGRYGLSESGYILEQSWLLHNVILPSWALLPLWWRFLQTLRHAYDEKRRWPHYGNSFKYLTATTIILYGMTHTEEDRSPWWILCFILAVFYQLWWDTVMDWELFIIAPKNNDCENCNAADNGDNNILLSWWRCWTTRISSLQPNSHILLNLQMYIFHPIEGMIRRISHSIPHYSQIRLRRKRLYKTKKFYYKIFVFNALFRFTWMLCFIPAYRLSSKKSSLPPSLEDEDSGSSSTIYSSDVDNYFGILLPVAEILRRMFWGILLLEKETIKMMDSDGHCVIAAYKQLETYERNADKKLLLGSGGGDNNDIAMDIALDNDDDDDDDDNDDPDNVHDEDHKLLAGSSGSSNSATINNINNNNSNNNADDGVVAVLCGSSNINNNNKIDNNDDDDDDKSQSSKEGASLLSSSPLARLSIPTWINTQQKLHHDAATTSRQHHHHHHHHHYYHHHYIRSKISVLLQFIRSEAFCSRLLVFELILWVVAFVGLGCWATN